MGCTGGFLCWISWAIYSCYGPFVMSKVSSTSLIFYRSQTAWACFVCYEFNFGFRMGWWYIFVLGSAWLGFNEGFRIGLCKFSVKIKHWVLKGVQVSLGLVLIFILYFSRITEVCRVYRNLWVGLPVGFLFWVMGFIRLRLIGP